MNNTIKKVGETAKKGLVAMMIGATLATTACGNATKTNDVEIEMDGEMYKCNKKDYKYVAYHDNNDDWNVCTIYNYFYDYKTLEYLILRTDCAELIFVEIKKPNNRIKLSTDEYMVLTEEEYQKFIKKNPVKHCEKCASRIAGHTNRGDQTPWDEILSTEVEQ